MNRLFPQLQGLMEQFRSPLYRCPSGASFECGSILYSALIKEMEVQEILPIPMPPYSGLSISGLYTKMQRIRSPVWCRPGKTEHHCDLNAKVMAIADPVLREPNGPELKDFEFH